MKLFWFASLVLLPAVVFGRSEEDIIKRVHAHDLIHDYRSAELEAREGLNTYAHSQELWKAYIRSLAKLGEDQLMLDAWKSYIAQYPEEKKNLELTETVAWGILHNGSKSPSPLIRIYSMVGSHFSHDPKGVDLLISQMRDNNALIRAVAVQLASEEQDEKLRDEVKRLFRTETSFAVRLEVIQAAGTMKIRSLQPDLVALVTNESTSAEEKAAAIQSLVNLLETANREEVARLAQCDRAGLRDLACQVVNFFRLERDLDLIVPLINDHRPEVREGALKAIATLRVNEYRGQPITALVERRLNDLDPHVALMAAKVITLHDQSKGHEAFRKLLKHKTKEIRYQASAALASCGRYGLPLMYEAFNESSDPYVRMNLAIGLLGLRQNTYDACEALYQGLTTLHEKWMLDEDATFHALVPSKIKHDELIPNYPEAVNQKTRLEVLNYLAVMKYPKAQDALKAFLQERQWGISGMASVVLLTEGDDSAIDLVSRLLNDSDPKIRLQAALILSIWGRGENAISALVEAYPSADREMKEKILEGLGRLNADQAKLFLVDRLHEQHQSLRIIAASALLMSLYQ
jgi:HEAT repeat protein